MQDVLFTAAMDWLTGFILVAWLYGALVFLSGENLPPWLARVIHLVLVALAGGVTVWTILKIGLPLLGVCLVFYILYCWSVSCWERAKVAGSIASKVFWFAIAIPAFVPGLVLDVVFNATVATFPIFWEASNQWTLTKRLSAYKFLPKYANTWRCAVATAVCKILDPWQNGGHCSKP